MNYYVSNIRQFNRGQIVCIGMNVHIPYEGRYLPFYIECRTNKGEDGRYYATPDEKTLTYISDENVRNTVREKAGFEGTEYLNTEKDEAVY